MKTALSILALLVLLACTGAAAQTSPPDAATISPRAPDIALPARCGRVGALYRCNPVTNEGCDGAHGETCDVDPDHGFGCYPPPNDVVLGGDCNIDEGPSCGPKLSCVTDGSNPDGTCSAFCCGDGDCPMKQKCIANDPAFGTLGTCR